MLNDLVTPQFNGRPGFDPPSTELASGSMEGSLLFSNPDEETAMYTFAIVKKHVFYMFRC